MGIYLSDHDHDCLTNLRFADDVLLFATSKEQTRKMLCGFEKSTEKVGQRIHPDKTKILSNQGSMGDIPQIQTVADIEKLLAQTSSPAVRRSGYPNDEPRIRNMGTQERTRKNDTIDATQDVTTRHSNKKKIQKDRETR